MNLTVEDEYHCSKRQVTLATVIFLLVIIPTPAWCLSTTYVALSGELQYPQLEMEQCLKRAADTIHFYTGLNTEINIRIILHPDGFTFHKHAFPSWSAAVYREGEIHLRNPHLLLKKGILENALSHEFFHAVIHQNSLFLPQWFEEGFAYFLFPASLQELNGKMNGEDSSKIKALDFYSDSYIMVRKLMGGKSQREIQDFFLFCKESGFIAASQKYFKISVF
ncbi:MAG TPA: hypothetical protein DCY12_08595 [Candidatus Atribacteria bacterium]|nr:hypothetical protein [Candidatus Atribacteria bacterium]HCU22578.1 hypothetical protein [Candidatus Atribacteria bacterium]